MRPAGLVWSSLFCLILCLGTGCDARSDVERLQGNWRLHGESGDFELAGPRCKSGGETLTFSGSRFAAQYEALGFCGRSGTFSCDTNTSPHRITFDYGSHKIVAIYSIGRWLEICVGENATSPPADFSSNSRTGRPALLDYEYVPRDIDELQGTWHLTNDLGTLFDFGLPPGKRTGGFPTLALSGDEFTFENSADPGHCVSGKFACDDGVGPKRITFLFSGRELSGNYGFAPASCTSVWERKHWHWRFPCSRGIQCTQSRSCFSNAKSERKRAARSGAPA